MMKLRSKILAGVGVVAVAGAVAATGLPAAWLALATVRPRAGPEPSTSSS
jgi:hypothetical protein